MGGKAWIGIQAAILNLLYSTTATDILKRKTSLLQHEMPKLMFSFKLVI
jgi:hypothetical protein